LSQTEEVVFANLNQGLMTARARIQKEVLDVEHLVSKDNE
jgi:hypothetical protein